MNTQILPFRHDGNDIRVVTVDGEPWFVASDVAKALGYRDAFNMARRIDTDDMGTHSVSTPGGMQEVGILSEPGLYSAILGSQLESAKEFKRWITSEVIPSIRKTGSYAAPVAQREIPQDFASALREFAAEIEAHEQTKAALDVAQPRAEAWDAIASAEGDYSVGDAAKILARAGIPTGPQRLFDQLGDLKWTFRGEGGKWRAYAERVEKGYLAERPQFHYHPKSGERVVDPPQLRVTVKGLGRLRQRMHPGALAVVS